MRRTPKAPWCHYPHFHHFAQTKRKAHLPLLHTRRTTLAKTTRTTQTKTQRRTTPKRTKQHTPEERTNHPFHPKEYSPYRALSGGRYVSPQERKNHRRYKCEGEEGGATFYAFIQVLIFIPRNVPIHPFGQPSGHPGKRLCPFSETGASPQGKGWRFSGKRWESRYTNREKAGCRSGNGYIPVQREGRLLEYALFLINLKSAGIGESRS